MSFKSGNEDTTPEQQMIAFWTHTIDMYMYQFYEHRSTMAGICCPVTKTVTNLTGITSEEALMGAVRAGLKECIAALPDNVRISVEEYFVEKVRMLYTIYSYQDLIKCDVIFGDKDPTNFYYSGVRLQHHVPLTSKETDIEVGV